MTLRESIVDALVDVRVNKGRTILQTLGVILGVGSLVAVQGLTDAGRRQALDFFSELGGLRKILVLNKPIKSRVQSARELASDGLTWGDVQAIKRDVTYATQVDPISTNDLMVRSPSYI